MDTFFHILKSINWVDITLLILLIRVVFIAIKTGFATEFFKLFGVFIAVFFGLHYYSVLAAIVSQKTGWSIGWLELAFFVLIVSLIVVAVKFLRDGFNMVFKFETTHAGINQWGAGILGVLRAVLLASLIIHGILLSNVQFLQKQTLTSISSKLVLKAAPNTYAFVFNYVIGKIFQQERLNEDVFNVASKISVGRKKYSAGSCKWG